jgi:hypothetical protein
MRLFLGGFGIKETERRV